MKRIERPDRRNLQRLQGWNVGAAILLLLEAILIIVFSKEISWPVLANHLTIDPIAVAAGSQSGPVLASHTLFTINPQHVVVAWLIISAGIHGLVASKWRAKYEKGLAGSVSPYRWVEMGVSSTLVVLAIAMAAGLRDVASLALLLGASLVMHTVGAIGERHQQDSGRSSLGLFVLGAVSGLATWAAIGAYVWATVVYGDQGVAGYVYGLLLTLLVTCTGVALVQYRFRQAKGHRANYLAVEKTFLVLIVLSQSAAAWLMLAAK
jgi:hypothetical protein